MRTLAVASRGIEVDGWSDEGFPGLSVDVQIIVARHTMVITPLLDQL